MRDWITGDDKRESRTESPVCVIDASLFIEPARPISLPHD